MPESTTTTFTGVFPTNEVKIELDTASTTARTSAYSSGTFAEVADMESAEFSIETGVETWFGIKEGGWQKALATSKSITISCSGKRCVGDTGNDYVFSKWNKVGQACNSWAKLTFPDDTVLVVPVVIKVNKASVTGATGVAPLEFDLVSDGAPQETTAS